MAVLHGEERLANLQVTSDVDIVTDRPVGEVLAATQQYWERRGLYPIILWPYDVGGTGSIFLVGADATEGVQVDVLHDLHGRGQYGFMTEALLGHTVTGRDFPRLDEDASGIYIARKRQVKAREEFSGGTSLDELAYQLLSPGAAQEFLAADVTRRTGGWYSRLRWLFDRLRRPVGAWIHLVADDFETSSHVAESLKNRLSRFLPHVGVGGLRRFPARIWWWLREVAPVRWRAGVFISWATEAESTHVGSDIIIRNVDDPELTAARVVRELRARLHG